VDNGEHLNLSGGNLVNHPVLPLQDFAAVWDAEQGAEICRITGCTPLKETSSTYPWNKRVVLSEDGSLVAISNAGGSFDQRLADGVLVFEVESGRLHKALATGYSSAIGPLGFAQKGTRLVTSSLHQRPVKSTRS
jgi:hypothetical protein